MFDKKLWVGGHFWGSSNNKTRGGVGRFCFEYAKKGSPLVIVYRNCVFAGFNQLSVPKISYPSRHVAKISTTFKIAAPPIKRRDRTLIVDTHFFRLHWIFKILKRVCHAFLNKTRMVTLLPNERSERLRTPPIVSCCRIVAREVYPWHLLELVMGVCKNTDSTRGICSCLCLQVCGQCLTQTAWHDADVRRKSPLVISHPTP